MYASAITPRLLVGGIIRTTDDVSLLFTAGVTHIVNVAAELDDAPLFRATDIMTYKVGWYDDGQPKPCSDFINVLGWTAWQCAQHWTVKSRLPVFYVHCAAGIHRGPLMATFLVAAWSDITAISAYQIVRAGHPQAASFDIPAYQQSCESALRDLKTGPDAGPKTVVVS